MIDGRTYIKFRLRGDRIFLSNEEKKFFVIFFLIAMFKFAYYGYAYVPFLDDYVQYGLYPNLEDTMNRVFLNGAKTIYTRPFATITDVCVIGKLGLGGLGIVLFCLSGLYATSALLFYVSFKAINMRLTVLFPIIYTLFPITTEGTYWVSASSRIVTSLFCISFLLFLAVRFKGKHSVYKTLIIWIINALSYGFYEQTAILSFALTLYFSLKLKDKRMAVIGVLNFVLLAVYYLAFSAKGDNAERVMVQSFGKIVMAAPLICAEILRLWFIYSPSLSIVAFKRGFEILISDNAYFWFIIMIIFAVSIFIAMSKIKVLKISMKNISNKSKKLKFLKNEKLIVGFIFFVVPYIPFFITGNAWLNFRNLNASMLGFSLIADVIAERFLKSSEMKSLISAVLTVFFLVGNVSEIRDYSIVAYSDFLTANKIAENITVDTEVVDVTLKKKKPTRQNLRFKDHIIGITETDYGITGAVRALSGNYAVLVECSFSED